MAGIEDAHGWTADQIAIARALHEIERAKLECPECGAGVPRPKCVMEMGPGCPGHEAGASLEELQTNVRRLTALPADWRSQMPQSLQVRPPTETELEGLRWMAAEGRIERKRGRRDGETHRHCFLRVPARGNPPEVVQRLCELGVAVLGDGPKGRYVHMGPHNIEYAEAHGIRFEPAQDAA